jgi:hypothetical protein
MALTAQQIALIASADPSTKNGRAVLTDLRSSAGDRGSGPALVRVIDQLLATPRRETAPYESPLPSKLPTRRHTFDAKGNEVVDPGVELTTADVTWLQRLPTDPALMSAADVKALVAMTVKAPPGSSGDRLVADIVKPVIEYHERRVAEHAATTARSLTLPALPSELSWALAATLRASNAHLTEGDAAASAAATLAEARATAEARLARTSERIGRGAPIPDTRRTGSGGDAGRAEALRRFGPADGSAETGSAA